MDEQCDTMDGLEEGAPGVLALLERAGKKGLDWLVRLAGHFSGIVRSLPFPHGNSPLSKCMIHTDCYTYDMLV